MVSETRKAAAKKLKAEAATLVKAQRFVEGEHIGLRAVTEGDLGRLAQLMAESPLVESNPQPWTEQALKRKYENKKEPGLWADKKRFYLAVDKAGEAVGFIIQQRQFDGCYEISLHVGDSVANHDAVGTDMLEAYMRLMADWNDPVRVEGYILQLETGKASWLKANGFELECTFEQMYIYQGQPVASQIWGWVNQRVLD